MNEPQVTRRSARWHRDGYLSWSTHAAFMDQWWGKRERAALHALEMTSCSEMPDVLRYARAAYQLAHQGRRNNAKFWLLMLLRTRASGGC